MGPRAGLDAVVKRKIPPLPLPEIEKEINYNKIEKIT
jgi:hypothetical protein